MPTFILPCLPCVYPHVRLENRLPFSYAHCHLIVISFFVPPTNVIQLFLYPSTLHLHQEKGEPVQEARRFCIVSYKSSGAFDHAHFSRVATPTLGCVLHAASLYKD